MTYVSLLASSVPRRRVSWPGAGEGDLDLMVLDSGHLTPKGSSYVGRSVFKPYLDRAAAR